MNRPHIAYTPRPDATPERELSTLAQIYKFVLESQKAARPTPEPDGRDDYERLANKERSPV
jgi:hypothetical protein